MNHPITVLVVEDEPLVLLDLVDELTENGFRVLEATNATAALEMLVAHSEIQIMFTDVDMPGGMDGLMLAAAVRDRWPPIKIIVTSGHAKVEMSDIPAESLFFSKPYSVAAIATAMREMVI
jgi:CheY-like chemotaxis protein